VRCAGGSGVWISCSVDNILEILTAGGIFSAYLGLSRPLGAFIASWGGVAMLTSAPFDNWCHAAYGLDVKIVSPPHVLLFIGVYAVILGTLALIAAQINRSPGKTQQTGRWLFLYVTGIMLVQAMIIIQEYTERTELHSSLPYIVLGAIPLITLAVGFRVTRKSSPPHSSPASIRCY
jgi:FtsH-binding integral membrane protein